MGIVIRPTDRSEAVTRLPAERTSSGRQAHLGHLKKPEAQRQTPVFEQPKGASSNLDPELTHLSAVAAATIADANSGSLLDKALKAAQAKADQEIAHSRDEARKQGRQEGFAKGQEDGRKVWDEKLARLAKLGDEFQELRDQVLGDAEDKLVELVFEATTRILGEALATREGVAAVSRQVLTAARDQTKILTIRLAPADFELLGGTDESIPKVFRPGVAVVADARVHMGGCLLDTAQGSIDGRLEIQLERLKDAILEARNGHRK